MDVLVYVVAILAMWLLINAFYKLWGKVIGSKTVSIDLKYGIVLVIKKYYKSMPSKTTRKTYFYALLALYSVALGLAVYAIAVMIYTGLFERVRGAVLLIPGLNVTGEDLVYFILAASMGIALHEYFHAKTALRAGVPVRAYGIVLALILPSAFVEIDEKFFEEARKLLRVSVLAAGVVANMVMATLSLGALTYTTSPTGFTIVSVLDNSLAEKYGLKPYDVVYKINESDASLTTLSQYLSRNETLVLVLTVYRKEAGYLNLTVVKGTLDSKLGVLVYQYAPPQSLVNALDPRIFVSIHRLFTWIYIVNFSLMAINSLPLFITDGGRIAREVLGEKVSQVVSISTMLIFLVALIVSARV